MLITVPPDITFHVLFGPNGQACDFWRDGDPELPDPKECPTVKRTMTFCADFVRRTLLVDASFGADMDSVLTAQELRGYFAGRRPGDTVDVPQAALDKITAAMRKPTMPYSPIVMGALSPFFRAISHPSGSAEKSLPTSAEGVL